MGKDANVWHPLFYHLILITNGITNTATDSRKRVIHWMYTSLKWFSIFFTIPSNGKPNQTQPNLDNDPGCCWGVKPQ